MKIAHIGIILTLSLCAPLMASEQIQIHRLIKLDGESKANIYKARKQYVQEYPFLAPLNYEPSDTVFGQIVDGKPWWGMLGMCGYGPGAKSIEGPSKESEFIINPFILIGIKNDNAVVSSRSPSIAYPVPLALFWDKEGKTATVTYDVRSFWTWQKRVCQSNIGDLCLNTYNARDFGYAYFSIDPDYSENISGTAMGTVAPNIQYIHCGGSCGYPGGCNNESPYQQETEIRVSKLPAHASVKLWRNHPDSAKAPSDMTFIVEMM